MKKWALVLSHNAEKHLEGIPKKQRDRIWKNIKKLAEDPYNRELDVKPLKGRADWRLRIGGWRVIFRIDGEKIVVIVLSIDPRGDAYKD